MMAIPIDILVRSEIHELCHKIETAPIKKFQLTTIKTNKDRMNEKDQS